ncbi:hypothetical protein ACFLXV_01400 [Chloroflexota bacterium]
MAGNALRAWWLEAEWHRGELLSLVGIVVPNLSAKARSVVALLLRAWNGGAVDQ